MKNEFYFTWAHPRAVQAYRLRQKGYKLREIAEKMDISAKTVGSYLLMVRSFIAGGGDIETVVYTKRRRTVSIISATHDWAQIEYQYITPEPKTRYYQFSLKNDGLCGEAKWRDELEKIGKTRIQEMKRRYHLTEILKEQALFSGIEDMNLVRLTHGGD